MRPRKAVARSHGPRRGAPKAPLDQGLEKALNEIYSSVLEEPLPADITALVDELQESLGRAAAEQETRSK